MLKDTDAPIVIDGSGQETFGKNQYCLWNTTDGSTSICTIQNPGTANTLTVVISGAPDTMYTTSGVLLNGKHQIPPNNPDINVTALGDFQGKQVTIFNMSALDTPCALTTVAGGSTQEIAAFLASVSRVF